MITIIDKFVRQIQTNDIRNYLSVYESEGKASKITIDNIRKIISSFFAWLEDQNYIIKSPAQNTYRKDYKICIYGRRIRTNQR